MSATHLAHWEMSFASSESLNHIFALNSAIRSTKRFDAPFIEHAAANQNKQENRR